MRDAQAYRTMMTTEHYSDARLCGFDGPMSPLDGGYSVAMDGRGRDLRAVLEGASGEFEIEGAQAMEQIAAQLLKLAQIARRMEQQ